MTSVGLRWEELLMPLLQKYKLNITWGDQDLLNIIFHHNPGKAAHTTVGIACMFTYAQLCSLQRQTEGELIVHFVALIC